MGKRSNYKFSHIYTQLTVLHGQVKANGGDLKSSAQSQCKEDAVRSHTLLRLNSSIEIPVPKIINHQTITRNLCGDDGTNFS